MFLLGYMHNDKFGTCFAVLSSQCMCFGIYIHCFIQNGIRSKSQFSSDFWKKTQSNAFFLAASCLITRWSCVLLGLLRQWEGRAGFECREPGLFQKSFAFGQALLVMCEKTSVAVVVCSALVVFNFYFSCATEGKEGRPRGEGLRSEGLRQGNLF